MTIIPRQAAPKNVLVHAIMRTNLFVLLKYISAACVIAWGFPVEGFSKTIAMPMTIDYPLLRSLVISTAFPESGNKAVVLDEAQGCRKITVSEPAFSEERGYVRLETKVSANIGVSINEKCLFPIRWDGYLALTLVPRIDPERWRLSFREIDSAIYDKDHDPAIIAGIVWKLVKAHVFQYLKGITIDLAPPVIELKAFLPPLFPSDLQKRARKFVDSMRPGFVSVTPDAVRVPILADIEEPREEDEIEKPEGLSEEELDRLTRSWETWDIFLVHLLTSLKKRPLSDEERNDLLSVMLESRYRFIGQLTSGTLSDEFVREQFIWAWNRLSPVFRGHLGRESSGRLLSYLSFFTAADALSSLGDLGPTLGIDISRDGFIRLARLLAEDTPTEMIYGTGIDMDLRSTLGLGPPLEILSSPGLNDETRLRVGPQPSIRFGWPGFLKTTLPAFSDILGVSTVEARPSEEALREWLVTLDNADQYLPWVRDLLAGAARDIFLKGQQGTIPEDLFRDMVLATGWQESCWRQFRRKEGQITYLRSYNGTSVGLMQINERVWRGLYQLEALRWNIRYNVSAGCEILHLYLTRYILRKATRINKDGTLNHDLVPGLLYAMYNGGPGQFGRFLKRRKKGRYHMSDKLFLEKYRWVKDEQWDMIRKCLFGG